MQSDEYGSPEHGLLIPAETLRALRKLIRIAGSSRTKRLRKKAKNARGERITVTRYVGPLNGA